MPGLRATMKEYAAKNLHSGSQDGPVVTNPKQAVAIALSEGRKAGEDVPPKPSGKGFKHHHTEAGKAHAKGDHKMAMHHVGHMLGALKSSEGSSDESEFADAGEAGELAPKPSSLRSRLSSSKGVT